MNKLGRILYTVLATTIILFSSCSHEEDWMSLPNGKLQFTIGQISTETGTRATPSELGKPLADKFNLKVQRVNSDYIAYEGSFVESMEIKVGSYNITASCGDDVLIGRDAPYYIGTTQATIKENQPTSATIPCRVGNALVSVRFGRNQAEQQRFAKFYEEYGLLVKNGDNSMAIGKDETASSIYFPAETSPELIFYGTLKLDGGRTVSTTLTHKSLPTVFDAADHAIITISLPDPESAIAVNISKVELVEAKLDETIPLSWLPVPTVNTNHSYNSEGFLMGTDLTFSNSYPEMIWEARVSNEQGDTVRRVTGSGVLSSLASSSEDWPYLQAGIYRATYFLHTEDGVSKISSRGFTVGSPNITVQIEGFTSYSKYLEGDIESANAADGYKLYSPEIKVKIAPKLTGMAKYAYKLSYTFNGTSSESTSNTELLGDKNLEARLDQYMLHANVEFAGEQASNRKGFYITGIPFHFEPPTTSTWNKSGDVTDEGEYARFGRWNGGSQSLTYSKVAMPAGLRLDLDYKFKPNAGAITTTFTISAGNQELVSGKADSYKNPTYEGIKQITLGTEATSIKCHNSYGAGATGTDLYRVGMRYRE